MVRQGSFICAAIFGLGSPRSATWTEWGTLPMFQHSIENARNLFKDLNATLLLELLVDELVEALLFLAGHLAALVVLLLLLEQGLPPLHTLCFSLCRVNLFHIRIFARCRSSWLFLAAGGSTSITLEIAAFGVEARSRALVFVFFGGKKVVRHKGCQQS